MAFRSPTQSNSYKARGLNKITKSLSLTHRRKKTLKLIYLISRISSKLLLQVTLISRFGDEILIIIQFVANRQDVWSILEYFGVFWRHFESGEGPGTRLKIGKISTAVKRPRRFSFYLVGFKWKHGQGCIKYLVNVTIF